MIIYCSYYQHREPVAPQGECDWSEASDFTC